MIRKPCRPPPTKNRRPRQEDARDVGKEILNGRIQRRRQTYAIHYGQQLLFNRNRLKPLSNCLRNCVKPTVSKAQIKT